MQARFQASICPASVGKRFYSLWTHSVLVHPNQHPGQSREAEKKLSIVL